MSRDPRRMATALSIPAYRQQVHIGLCYQIASLVTFYQMNKIELHLHFCDTSHLSWSRNMLLWTALDKGADWCLFTDADTACTDAPGIVRMLDEGNRRRAAVIAAPMPMRNRPGYNVVCNVGKKCECGAPVDQLGNVTHKPDCGCERLATEDEIKGGVNPVERIGTGLFAISCGWLMQHWAPGDDVPWFNVRQVPASAAGQPPGRTGEDYWFCDEVRKRGGVILADGRLNVLHVHNTSDVVALSEIGVQIIEDERLTEHAA